MTNKYFYYSLLLALAFSFTSTSLMAEDETKQKHSMWIQEIRDYKHDFFTKEIDLTKAQQQEFFPLYTEMEREIFQINKDAREMEKKITIAKGSTTSDLEYEKVAEAMSEVKMKEAEIEAEYFQKFAKILSKKQLFQLKRAENRFTRSMLNHHKGGDRNSPKTQQ